MIQVLMVHSLDHFALQNVLQFFQVKDHAGCRIGFSRNRHFERVIVSVSMRIATFAEDALVSSARTLGCSKNAWPRTPPCV